MKNLRYFLLAFALLLTAVAAGAQETKMKANIPFDFMVGERVYPAGQYLLNSISGNGAAIRIDGNPEVPASLVLTHACETIQPSKQTKLVFRRVGENYFLHQVWIAGNSLGREFHASREEIRLAQNREQELVVVAANTTK